MAQEPAQDRQAFAQILKDSLQKAQGQISGLRKTNKWLVIASIVSSAATTLVAGATAAAGPVVGSGTEGWKFSCLVAAVFAFVSTVATALIQQMKTEERLVQGTQCVGRLLALQVAMATSSQNLDRIAGEYSEIVRTFPDFCG
jgi:hypothetical protein